MKKIIKARWAILAVWLVATILLTVFQPNINTILRNRGSQALDKKSPSVVADNLLKKMDIIKGSNDIIVFYDKNRLSAQEMSQIKGAVASMTKSKRELGIDKIVDPYSMPAAKASLISKDGTTMMISFKMNKGSRSVKDIKKQFDSRLTGVKSEYYYSGEDFINDDYQSAAETGVSKSARLTVLFILLVLILMFRSVVTPLISIVAVAFSYLCSMGIAAQLIDKANFPVTSLTQMLLILILFGIGTDYNILLFNRFKEELAHGHSTDDAIVNTYKTAGKTIAFSILTVFIAFFSLIFSESPIYRSGIVVVIGTAVLLLEIMTLTPLAMKGLGSKLFWPTKKATRNGHKESKVWGKISTLSTKHPIVSIVAILLIIVPMIVSYQSKLSFDTLGEMGNSYPSSKGFNIVAQHFGRGQAMPTTIVIQNGSAMDNNTSMAVIDHLTESIKKIKGVQKVSSITQPQGKPIEGFYTDSQMSSVVDGVSKTQGGVDQIYDGLKLASDKLSSADFSQVNQMVDGTGKLQSGVQAMGSGLKQIETGLSSKGNNTRSISSGLKAIEINLSKMSAGIKVLSDSYTKLQDGYGQMGAHYQGAAQALLGVKNTLAQMKTMVAAIGGNYAKAQSDATYLALKQTIDQLNASLAQITPEGIKALNDNYNAATAGFGSANAGLAKMGSGLAQMAAGMKKLESGLDKASSGIGVIAVNMDSVAKGLGQMKTGQEKLVAGLSGFSTFGHKLSDVNGGLKKISDGLGKTNGFLTQLSGSKTFFIPKEALANPAFEKALDNFYSSDRKYTKLIVVMNYDPYSLNATKTVEKINDTVASGLKGTILSKAKAGVSGPSATTNDMNNVLSRDLNRTAVIVLIGVFLILVLVTRSLWSPVCITGSLVGAYFAGMFLLNRFFLDVKGYEGISSFVPFFSFIVIVALGVDYSIFLMMRFKEYPELSPREAIVMASKQIGGVVMSAAIILGGTFATLMPSGLVQMEELGAAVITGLVVLCFVLLPIFLPAMIALPGTLKKLFLKNKAGREAA